MGIKLGESKLAPTVTSVQFKPESAMKEAFNNCVRKREESALANIVLPLLAFVRTVLFCPDYFAYEGHTEVVKISGSKIRKIAIFTLQALQTCHIVGLQLLKEMEMTSGQVRTLHRGVTSAYVMYNLSMFWSLNAKVTHTHKLLQKIQKLERDFQRSLAAPASGLLQPQKAKVLCWSLIAVYSASAVIFALFVRMHLTVLIQKGLIVWAERVALCAVNELHLLFGYRTTFDPTKSDPVTNLLASLPYLAFGLFYDLHWALGFLLNFAWGITFVLLFKIFYEWLDSQNDSELNMVQGIRKFNEISFALETFNEAFGGFILGAVVSGGSHFAVYIMAIFNAESEPVGAAVTTLCFVLYWAQLLAVAEVSRQAEKMKKVLKRRYNSGTTMLTCTKCSGMEPAATQGIVMLFTELSTSCIGFEGLGFFTLTYALIGSVVSLILTYAIVTLQMS